MSLEFWRLKKIRKRYLATNRAGKLGIYDQLTNKNLEIDFDYRRLGEVSYKERDTLFNLYFDGDELCLDILKINTTGPIPGGIRERLHIRWQSF